jgi:hypothetical protein
MYPEFRAYALLRLRERLDFLDFLDFIDFIFFIFIFLDMLLVRRAPPRPNIPSPRRPFFAPVPAFAGAPAGGAAPGGAGGGAPAGGGGADILT